jgi:Phage ABA sandwich domain
MNVWDTLPAGAELDMMVAEQVLGKKRGRCPGAIEETDGGFVCDSCFRSWDFGEELKAEHDFVPDPYSTSITAAWALVERYQLHVGPGYSVEHEKWIAGVSGWTFEGIGDEDGRGDTAPVAICRAALEVARVRIEKGMTP